MLQVKQLTTALIGPISIELEPGRCTAILGASGSGKSLLLRAIADLDPSEGEVTLNGRSRSTIAAPEWRKQVALVPAESGWWADRVVEHFSPGDSFEDALQSVNLVDAAQWDINRLSTGERHRLAIARALQGKPDVVLLDEPTASLDPEATQVIEALIQQQCARGVAILLVTHDPEQATRIAHDTFTMQDGALTPTNADE